MILIVGLGNPGRKYEKTRHNIGFQAINYLKSLNLKGVILAKPKTFMNLSGKAVKSLIAKYKISPTRAKRSAKEKDLSSSLANLWVIHDDIDLPLGKFKIQKNRGSAGHKGVQSIINELGTKDFWRVRIGICPPSLSGRGKPKDVKKLERQAPKPLRASALDRPQEDFARWFVLKKFNKKEEEIVKEVIKRAVEKIGITA